MKPGMSWPIGVSVILAATVVGNLIMMHVANSDPSMAIEPDYYKKAVAFDSTMANERRSNALGWHAVSSIDSIVAGRATRVRLSLTDADGGIIGDATVHAVALFNARANDLQEGVMRAEQDGSYSVPLAVQTPGEWEVRIDAVRGGAHFVSTSRVDAVAVTHAIQPPTSDASSGATRP